MIIETRIEGPVGCGKTTELHSLLEAHANKGRNCLLILSSNAMVRHAREHFPELNRISVVSAKQAFATGWLDRSYYDVVAMDDGDRFPHHEDGALVHTKEQVMEYFSRTKKPARTATRHLIYTCY